jgi:hypothetical protein
MKGTLNVDELSGYVTKGVTFNADDPDQKELLKHALSRKNFSGYIKRLIQRDYEKTEKPQTYKSAGGGMKIDLRNQR